MSLKSVFKNATNAVARFLDRQEIHAVKSCKEAAESGYGYIAARGGAVKVRLTPEKAKETIENCDRRLDVLYKRNPDSAPKP
ncbi:MAG: hypothetical protein ACXW30_01605 [Micavibrio sp.]